MQNKTLSTLGICRKAGKLILGYDETAKGMEQGTAKLLVLASDLSPKSEKEITRLADRQKITTVRLDATMDELWYALGKRAGILAVTDQGLADKIAAQTDARRNEEEKSV